jgi:hypothetical protein
MIDAVENFYSNKPIMPPEKIKQTLVLFARRLQQMIDALDAGNPDFSEDQK